MEYERSGCRLHEGAQLLRRNAPSVGEVGAAGEGEVGGAGACLGGKYGSLAGYVWIFRGRLPLATVVESQNPSAMKDYGDVDRWIAQLMECKPLSEAEVIQLCTRVT